MPLLHKSDNCGLLLFVLPGATILKLKTSSFIGIRWEKKTTILWPPANEIVAGKENQWMLKAISERNWYLVLTGYLLKAKKKQLNPVIKFSIIINGTDGLKVPLSTQHHLWNILAKNV